MMSMFTNLVPAGGFTPARGGASLDGRITGFWEAATTVPCRDEPSIRAASASDVIIEYFLEEIAQTGRGRIFVEDALKDNHGGGWLWRED